MTVSWGRGARSIPNERRIKGKKEGVGNHQKAKTLYGEHAWEGNRLRDLSIKKDTRFGNSS